MPRIKDNRSRPSSGYYDGDICRAANGDVRSSGKALTALEPGPSPSSGCGLKATVAGWPPHYRPAAVERASGMPWSFLVGVEAPPRLAAISLLVDEDGSACGPAAYTAGLEPAVEFCEGWQPVSGMEPDAHRLHPAARLRGSSSQPAAGEAGGRLDHVAGPPATRKRCRIRAAPADAAEHCRHCRLFMLSSQIPRKRHAAEERNLARMRASPPLRLADRLPHTPVTSDAHTAACAQPSTRRKLKILTSWLQSN
jgi:hypothetical protein